MTDKATLENFKEEVKKEDLVPFGWKILKADKLLKADLPESEFLVDKLIPKSAITILAGKPSSGKSWLLLEIAKCVSSNQSLFGQFETEEAKCLFIDEETPAQETKRRWTLLKSPKDVAVEMEFMNMESFKIDNQESRNGLLDLCDYRNYKFLVFDSLRDLHLANENDSREAQQLMDYFREFTRRGITILICHHNRKESYLNPKDPSQVLRGSSVLLAGTDSLLSVENTKKTEKSLELIISQPKLRQGRPAQQFKVSMVEEGGNIKFNYETEIDDEDTKLEKTKEAIIELLKDGKKYQSQIIDILIPQFFSPRTIRRAIDQLKDTQQIQPTKGENRKIYLSLI